MTAVAPTLQAFFVSRLGRQRGASPQTVDSYRHAFRLLLAYAETQTGKKPSQLDMADLDAALVSGFLDHLQDDRANSVASRNTRLAAVHSFFHFASYRHPEHAETIQQVLAIPRKKNQSVPRSFLASAEMDALVSAPDLSTWCGRRDHVLLVVALRTGLRLSELTGLRCRDVVLGPAAHVKCLGKGRKRRDTPLDQPTVKLLRSWLGERQGETDDALFPSRRGGRLSPDAVQRLVAKHVAAASGTCPSLANKHVSAHNLRHSCAMDLLRNGLDVAVLAMWLGHEKLESVNAYINADPTLKERALDRQSPLNPAVKPGRYKPSDQLLAFLENL
ncbi:MAG: tyrosine-type recombinase/integrase [Mycobacteriales bacterium]